MVVHDHETGEYEICCNDQPNSNQAPSVITTSDEKHLKEAHSLSTFSRPWKIPKEFSKLGSTTSKLSPVQVINSLVLLNVRYLESLGFGYYYRVKQWCAIPFLKTFKKKFLIFH